MKNIFKKNQIIITALAIMIVIAGYLSFTNKDKPDKNDAIQASKGNAVDVVSDVDLSDLAQGTVTTPDATTTDDTNTDTTDVNTTGDTADDGTDAETTSDTTPVEVESGMEELGDISDQDILQAANNVTDKAELEIENEVPGEAVLVSANISSNYFISNKVEREQMRARNKESYKEIINSKDVSDALKEEAIAKLIALTDIAEKEMNAEIALQARGFSDALVSINEDKVDVIINAATLTDQQLVIIEDTVHSKTDIPVSKMSIIPVVTEE